MGHRSARYLAGLICVLAAPRADASSCVPGFDFGAFGQDSLTFGGGACTDSFNSALGTSYATQNPSGCPVNKGKSHSCPANDDGSVGTNASSGTGITINGKGTCINGAADTNGSSISSSGDYYTSNTNNGSVNLTPPTVPALPSATGSATQPAPGTTVTVSANNTLAPGFHYGSYAESSNGKVLTLSAGTYVFDDLALTGNASLALASSGQTVVYLTGNVSPANALAIAGGTITNGSGIPGNLVFMCGPNVTSLALSGGASAAYAIYCPTADITISGGGSVFGAVVGKTVTDQGGSTIHYDKALASINVGGFSCGANETSRASPIVATVPFTGGTQCIVQGTFEQPFPTQTIVTTGADIANFSFPFIKGHMRARKVSTLTTTASSFTGTAASDIVFDTGDGTHIPTVNTGGCAIFNGSCRNVFTVTQAPDTTTGVSKNPPLVQFKDGNAGTLGPLLTAETVGGTFTATDYQSLVRCVLQGTAGCTAPQLGGVDRSTVAVIPSSLFAGTGTRPQMIYFGATDGMLHAVCGDSGGTTPSQTNICPSVGTELWAFMPREQLARVASNSTRIDGSVRVVDAFGDFYGTGTKSFRTILTFQMAVGTAALATRTPAVYALDITDPANPAVLWEYTVPNPASLNTFELGRGMSVSQGVVTVNGNPTNVVFAETNNGNTANDGVVVVALNAETGQKIWQFGYQYPYPPRGGAADDLPGPYGSPGGAVIVDKTGLGLVTDVVFADLYGNLWEVDPATGTSRYGTSVPLFSFSTDFHPIGAVPAIFAQNGKQFAAFTSGGYSDENDSSWNNGNKATQYLIAANLSTPTGSAPLDENSGPPNVPISLPLGAGENGFAQVIVIGTQLFLTTDTADVNATPGYGLGGATGHGYGVNFASGTPTLVTYGGVFGGASSVAVSDNNVYASSSAAQQQVGGGAGVTTSAASINTMNVPRMIRELWLRTQ
jgi:hypothetical protein